MGLLVSFISAFFWAFFDLARKICLKKIDPYNFLILFSLFQFIFFFIWILFSNYRFDLVKYITPGVILVSINVLSGILFLKSLKISELSLTIPLLSFTPLFSTIFSAFVLNENLNVYQYFGILLIVFGTMVLYAKSMKIIDICSSLKSLVSNLGAKYMLIVSIIWSITPVLDKVCFKYSSINIHGLFQSIGMLFLLILLNFKNINFSTVSKKKFHIIIISILIGTLATILQYVAIKLTLVPLMEIIKRTVGQMLSVFLGNFFFNEKITNQKIFGISTISIGIVYILYLN